MKNKTTKSSGNVFVDLGFDQAEAAVLQMRANLTSDLRLYIEKRKLTQAQAAKRLGIAQSRVSDLVRGKWDKFSLEMLITLEARIGRRVRVEFAAYWGVPGPEGVCRDCDGDICFCPSCWGSSITRRLAGVIVR